MKRKVLLCLLILSVMCLSLVGCKERIPVPPVDTAKDVAKLAEEGMTLDQVNGLMSAQLKNTTTLHGAKKLEQQLSGAWKFGSVEGGLPEGSDAPYQVLIFPPDKTGEDCYMVFFQNKSVIGSDWFAAKTADTIKDLLEGTLTAQ